MADYKTPLQLTAPRYMKGYARTMWDNLVPLLISRGTTNISKSVVETYCQTYSISRQAYEDIVAYGMTDESTGKKNPSVTTYENAVKNLRGLASDLGLTPASQVQLQKLIIDSSDDHEGQSFSELVKDIKF
ncbi:phage terminase small subunit P27 family [Weissella paramesenteroides]|uniref:phage terminase small subunit P27 family n=1 Tax=Weissella paramesenteroides TaxID=1249 RepID=UPI002402722E|nr:phage terminase small subunit P27 family [Weissella paramesenteroides]MDF8366180.1 phage terminase small subunit P27 family [Weissella paramesenteroides]